MSEQSSSPEVHLFPDGMPQSHHSSNPFSAPPCPISNISVPACPSLLISSLTTWVTRQCPSCHLSFRYLHATGAGAAPGMAGLVYVCLDPSIVTCNPKAKTEDRHWDSAVSSDLAMALIRVKIAAQDSELSRDKALLFHAQHLP